MSRENQPSCSFLDVEAALGGFEEDKETAFEWDETFDDDFARMTVFVHGGPRAPVREDWICSNDVACSPALPPCRKSLVMPILPSTLSFLIARMSKWFRQFLFFSFFPMKRYNSN